MCAKRRRRAHPRHSIATAAQARLYTLPMLIQPALLRLAVVVFFSALVPNAHGQSRSPGSASSVDLLWVEYVGAQGPGAGKFIVLISGDEEYRSEEALPQLGKILAARHGFRCRVVFAIDPETGTIDPNNRRNIPGLDALAEADLMIIATRFRELPDEQMAHIDRYLKSGRPVIGMRTATHAFNYKEGDTYAAYAWNNSEGGFGRQILGETWIAHHGTHGKESTRGIIAPGAESHPIVRGITPGSIWGPTDVYRVRLPLPKNCKPIVLGQVLDGMTPDAAPVQGPKNDPLMPIAWTRTFDQADKPCRVFTTTMGSADDLLSEGTRRMLVNAVYWTLGMESQIPETGADVEIVGSYTPSPFAFNGFVAGVRPADHAWPVKKEGD